MTCVLQLLIYSFGVKIGVKIKILISEFNNNFETY